MEEKVDTDGSANEGSDDKTCINTQSCHILLVFPGHLSYI